METASNTWKFDAIGTRWQIGISEFPVEKLQELKKRISERIEEFDKNYSRFREEFLY